MTQRRIFKVITGVFLILTSMHFLYYTVGDLLAYDGVQTKGVVTKRSGKFQGSVDYTYVVNDTKYHGSSASPGGIRVGDEIDIYYSKNIPSFSNTEKRSSILIDNVIISCLLLLSGSFFLIRAVRAGKEQKS